jgi:MFS family permease
MSSLSTNQNPGSNPRFTGRYIVVTASFLVMVVSWGLYSVFGVFFSPLLTEFGWTRAMTAGAFSLSMILSGVLGVAMGGLADKYGPRVVVTVCGLFLGAGYLLMSQVNTLWQLYLVYGVVIGIGVSGIWVPVLSLVARWFSSKRSLVTGIVSSGLGIGGLVAPPLLSRLIASNDWRLSYIIQGCLILVVMLIGAQFLQREPARSAPAAPDENVIRPEAHNPGLQGFTLKEALRTVQFWLMFIIFLCLGFCGFSIMIHLVPHAIDMKISPVSAANTLSALNGVTVLGNFLLGGFIGDKIGNRKIFIIGSILMSAALVWQVFTNGEWSLYLFSVVFGFALGGMGTSESPLIARIFGLRSHGLIFGVGGLGYTIGSSIGPVVVGFIFDSTGSYRIAFLVCAAAAIISLIASLLLKPTKRLGIPL